MHRHDLVKLSLLNTMTDTDDNFDEQAWDRAKTQSVPQLILKVGRLLDERAIGRMRRQHDLEGLTRSHTRLLPHLDLAGTRSTELAERMDVTKQAVSQLVGDLEEMGMLERVPDPSDGRAKLVRFADPDSLFVGLGILDEIGNEAFRDSSDEDIETVRDVLDKALERLASSDH